MARTTVHKVVSEVAVEVDALCVVRISDTSARRTRAEARANVVTVMLKLNGRGIWRSPVRCCQRTLQRSFALSKFPDRGATSGGRTRPPTPTPRVRPTLGAHPDTQRPLAHDESTFNISDSPLWEESQQRHPSSDPEGGLKRLLQNDTLVVTRSVTLLP
jgi:hypothetical protein